MGSKVVKPAGTNAGRPKPPNAGKGRAKGSVNRTTAAVKEALSLAFEGIGGVPKLQAWAEENRTEFYKLWAKLLPTEVTGKDGAPFSITVKFEDPVEG